MRPLFALVAINLFMTPASISASPRRTKALTSDELDAFKLLRFDGARVRLKDLRAKATLISVWTDSCGPCLAELPLLQKLADTYAGDHDVAILALSFDPSREHPDTPTAAALDVAKRLGLRLPLLWDPSFQFMKLSRRKEVTFPTAFFISSSGAITEEAGFDSKVSEPEYLAKKRAQLEALKSAAH